MPALTKKSQKANQISVPEPKSVRLTKAHREDMVTAVINEWETQNPPPSKGDSLSMIAIIAPQIKKTAAYRRTQRLLATNLSPDDWRHILTESIVKVAVIDSEGSTRDLFQIRIPLSVATSQGLTGVPFPKWHIERNHSPSQLTRDDIEGEKPDDMASTKAQKLRIRMFSLVEANYVTVQVDRDSPAMVKRRKELQKYEEWKVERERLHRETTDVLDQFNSTKQVREAWPEMTPYMPAHIADPMGAVKLPVLATSRLNERLGIK
jgi:hypothetical protein